MSRAEIITPDFRAAVREAIDDAIDAEHKHAFDEKRFFDELRRNLERMDKLGMNWRGR